MLYWWRMKTANRWGFIYSPHLLPWIRWLSAHFDESVDAITTTSPLPEPKKTLLQPLFPCQKNPEDIIIQLQTLSSRKLSEMLFRIEPTFCYLINAARISVLHVPLWNATPYYHPIPLFRCGTRPNAACFYPFRLLNGTRRFNIVCFGMTVAAVAQQCCPTQAQVLMAFALLIVADRLQQPSAFPAIMTTHWLTIQLDSSVYQHSYALS